MFTTYFIGQMIRQTKTKVRKWIRYNILLQVPPSSDLNYQYNTTVTIKRNIL